MSEDIGRDSDNDAAGCKFAGGRQSYLEERRSARRSAARRLARYALSRRAYARNRFHQGEVRTISPGTLNRKKRPTAERDGGFRPDPATRSEVLSLVQAVDSADATGRGLRCERCNDLEITRAAGATYRVCLRENGRQGGAGLESVPEEQGRARWQSSNLPRLVGVASKPAVAAGRNGCLGWRIQPVDATQPPRRPGASGS